MLCNHSPFEVAIKHNLLVGKETYIRWNVMVLMLDHQKILDRSYVFKIFDLCSINLTFVV